MSLEDAANIRPQPRTADQQPAHGLIVPDPAAIRQVLEGRETRRFLTPEFFELQLRFAANMARVTNVPFEEALLHKTCIYRRLELPQPLNHGNPRWLEFLAAVQRGESCSVLADHFKHECLPGSPATTRCFSYNTEDDEQTIKIHFINQDPHPSGPLSDERLPARVAELRGMFASIRAEHPNATTVRGSSWIYNLPKYLRLFPASYTANLGRPDTSFTGMSLWGQFVNRTGEVRQRESAKFLAEIDRAKTREELLAAFPHPTLSARGDIQEFYKFYGFV